MKTVSSIQEWKAIRKTLKGTIGFVPTMGALHNGHLSLIKNSVKENDITVASIFVNPTQFNRKDDLDNYPVTMEKDLEQLQKLKTDYVFTPSFDDIYCDQYRYKVSENSFSKLLCGAHRPGHFDGVLTIVMKLFNIIRPDNAYFGEKDYQQLQLIKEMTHAFFLDINIVACPIIREESGLAMSSRNERLSKQARKHAALFYRELSSERPIAEICQKLQNENFEIDYIEEHFGRRFGAVTIDNIRIIDNVKI